MEYLYLLLAICASATLSIMSSLFGKRNASITNATPLYSLIVVSSACLSFGLICLIDTDFDIRTLGYSALYGIFYSVAMIGMFLAYRCGPTSLTAFIKQLSLICVALWGFLFWGNRLSLTVGAGLVLIVIALALCFAKKRQQGEAVVSLKWLLYAAMLLCGNAGCSIVQKYQQMAFDERTKNSFMLFGMLMALAFCLVLYLSKERCRLSTLAKGSVVFPILGGVSSAALNLLILLLMGSSLEESIIFPGIAVGGLTLTLLFSVVAYRERLTARQWIGLGCGTVALVFLNL